MVTPIRKHEHEELVRSLMDIRSLKEYKAGYDDFVVSFVPRLLGKSLVFFGNLMYGSKPSYGKFKAIEVIARVPYQSWEVMSYMLLTLFYSNEQKAIDLCKTLRFSRVSQDNETMHVVVISQLAKKHGQTGFLRYTLVPLAFSFFYFAASCILYIFSPRYAFELNYVFEDHAFSQYMEFIFLYEKDLKTQHVLIDFLHFYGRNVNSEYELFFTIACDEIIHRNLTAKKVLRRREQRAWHHDMRTEDDTKMS